MRCVPHAPSRARPRPRPQAPQVRWAALLVGTLAVLAAGCGRSPRTQFFTLAAVRPDTAQRSFAGAPLQVRAVHIPAVLDRPERVTARSPQRLDIIETQQWGGPLDDMIRRVLSRDLTIRLPAGMVLLANAPGAGSRGIVVDIQEFEPEADGNVVLDASWVVLGATAPGSSEPSSGGGALSHLFGGGRGQAAKPASAGQGNQPSARGQRRLRLHSGAGADAQVAAMSTLLGQLADAIVASLKST